MARIRSWRPELFESKRFAILSEGAQLMLLKLGSLADDEGLVRAEAHYLHATRYLYDSRTYAELDAMVDELEAARWIRTYSVDGDRYAELLGWRDPRALLYQAINRPTASRLPEPPPMPDPSGSERAPVALTEPSVSPHGGVRDGSGSGSGREGKGSGSDARGKVVEVSGKVVEVSGAVPPAPAPAEPAPSPAPSPVDTRPPPPLDLQAALERVRGASERRQLRLGRAAAKRADVQREGYVRRLPTSERCAPDG